MAHVNLNPEKTPLFEQFCQSQGLEPAGKLFESTRLAVIASDVLQAHLATECEIVALEKATCLQQIEPAPDLVLIHVSLDIPAGWRQILLYERTLISEMVAVCTRNNIPVCFYCDAGEPYWDLFSPLLLSIEIPVFSTCVALHGKMRQAKRENCHLLSPLLSSKRVNPYQVRADRELRRNTGFIVPEWATLATVLREDEWEQLATLGNVQVFDERISRKPVKFPLPGKAKNILLGSLDEQAATGLYRHAYASLVLDAPAARHKQVENIYKAMGYGLPVVTTLPREALPVEVSCLFAASLSEAVALAGTLQGNAVLRDALANRALQAFEAHHALYRVLSGLLVRMTGRAVEIPEPLISFVMPTIRADLIEASIRSYDGIQYGNKELVVAINNDAIALSDCKRIAKGRTDIRFLHVPQCEPVGRCLNVAIQAARGEFVAKIDDDDIYGPDYLSGFVHALRAVKFDLAGKVPAFWYEEADGSLLIKREFWKYHSCYKHLMGGTFFFRNDGLHAYGETVRGYADLEMQERMTGQNEVIISVGFFDYAHVRRSGEHHTWKLSQDDIRLATYRVFGDQRWEPALAGFWEENLRGENLPTLDTNPLLRADHYFYFQDVAMPVKKSQETRKIPQKKPFVAKALLFMMLVLEGGYLSVKKKLMARINAA